MDNELIAVADPSVERLYQEQDRFVAIAQQRASVYNRIKQIAIQATDISDWIALGDKLHLCEGGAKKAARVCGVNSGPPHQEQEALEDSPAGPGYLIKVTMTFRAGGDEITEIGAATSRDQFFAKVGRGDDAVWKPYYEVDKASIIKKAHTNCMIRGITSLLGLRGLTAENLEEAGLPVHKLKGVKYDSASKGGRGSEGGTVSAADLDAIKTTRAHIRSMVLELAEGDVEGAKTMLAALTAFKGRDGKDVPGVTSVDKLNPPRLDIALERIGKEHEAWSKDHPKKQAEMPLQEAAGAPV